jgi:Na+(H+)/acetate symporter ActP
VRRATEVLVALVFTKTAIYALFGIGLALLSRTSNQGISTLVGSAILVTGACFAPFMMLRLVHFAGNTNLAGEMFGTLRGGVQPIVTHLPTPGASRHDMARQAGHAAPPPQQASTATTIPVEDGMASSSTATSAAAGPAALAVVSTYEAASKAHDSVEHVTDNVAQSAEGMSEPPATSDRPRSGPSNERDES